MGGQTAQSLPLTSPLLPLCQLSQGINAGRCKKRTFVIGDVELGPHQGKRDKTRARPKGPKRPEKGFTRSRLRQHRGLGSLDLDSGLNRLDPASVVGAHWPLVRVYYFECSSEGQTIEGGLPSGQNGSSVDNRLYCRYSTPKAA